ncbi:MAG: Arm DNA-binding domain-containing protein [Xanthobacteraceae bacterium]
MENATGSDLIWDDEARGLCVRVYPDGAKSFIFLYHINGRQHFIRIGCSPGLSLKAARNRARELRRIVDEGCDPVGNERDRRWITSFEKFLRHVAKHVPTKARSSLDKAKPSV